MKKNGRKQKEFTAEMIQIDGMCNTVAFIDVRLALSMEPPKQRSDMVHTPIDVRIATGNGHTVLHCLTDLAQNAYEEMAKASNQWGASQNCGASANIGEVGVVKLDA